MALLFFLAPRTLQIPILSPLKTVTRKPSAPLLASSQAPHPHIFYPFCRKLLTATSPKAEKGRLSSPSLVCQVPHCLSMPGIASKPPHIEETVFVQRILGKAAPSRRMVSKYGQRGKVPWSKLRPKSTRKRHRGMDAPQRIPFIAFPWKCNTHGTDKPCHLTPPFPFPYPEFSAIFKLHIFHENS